MRNIPCNTAWTRRQKRWPYWDAGSAPQQVNLPDDFVLEKPRTPTAPGEAAVGFIPDGLATYEKTFDAPKEWEGKPVFLSFDGAYMNARVTVNRELLQLHPYGYTPFAVELTPWLRFDIPNQLEVTLQGTQPSSRWYSGAGLYREVSFWVGEPCYIDPRDLFLTTPVVERDSAQVLVEAQAQNTTSQPQEAVLEVTLSFQGQCAGDAGPRGEDVLLPHPDGGRPRPVGRPGAQPVPGHGVPVRPGPRAGHHHPKHRHPQD